MYDRERERERVFAQRVTYLQCVYDWWSHYDNELLKNKIQFLRDYGTSYLY